MAKQYLDKDGLLYFWQKIKNTFVPSTRTVNGKALSANISLSASDVSALPSSTSIPTKTSDLTNDSGYITASDVPEGSTASTTTPKMDGTAAVGTETAFARGDHRHPSDTSRVPTTRTVNGHALSSNVTVTASDIGVQSGAEVNQNAFSSISIQTDGSATTYTASNKQDSVNILFMPAESFVEQSATGGFQVTALAATSSHNGLMTSADKEKLDTIVMTNGKINSSVLPSYVDDVIEAYPRSGQAELSQNWLSATSGGSALTPETGKIYVLMASTTNYDANTQFRWGGSAYVKLADGGASSITNAEIDTIVAS